MDMFIIFKLILIANISPKKIYLIKILKLNNNKFSFNMGNFKPFLCSF